MNTVDISLRELLAKSKLHAEAERHAAIQSLHLLAEIERRRAFVVPGYASLWDYARKALNYSDSTAFQRISAMQALKANPELNERLETGAISISNLSQVQRVLKAEREQGYRNYTSEQRLDLFKKCEGKPSKEVARILADFSPLALRVQKERPVSDNRTEIRFIADPALVDKMHRVRDLSVARLRTPSSYPELVGLMSEVTLDKIDPLRKPIRKSKPAQIDDPTPSDVVTTTVRRQVWQAYEGRCGFVHPESGARCEATFGLEIEHCKPRSMGGSSRDPGNLKLLCKQHNQWEAIQAYGQEKMEGYLSPHPNAVI